MGALFNGRLWALIVKELRQIGRDRRLVGSLTVQPIMQVLLLGFALSASVSNLRLGVVDDSGTRESRALVSALTESHSFRRAGSYLGVERLGDALGRGELDAGLVIPRDYARDLQRGRATTVQLLLNGINANTAAISQGYAENILQAHGRQLRVERLETAGLRHGAVMLRPAYLYNPGLDSRWFIVTGVFGLLLILDGSIVASATTIKEREQGTIEQLLMSPASTTEIIIAKIAPLAMLMCLMVVPVIIVMRLVFHVPFRGSALLVMAGAVVCLLTGISLGTTIATFSRTAQQALLTAFFVNPALVTLSGVLTPIEAMPRWMQPLTMLNPVTHFVVIARGTFLKGSGIATLWPNFAALVGLTAVLVSLSVWRFRKQLT
ncbi:MAG TPA: ABC transporter permease [Thermoanaerobaculia bacterium]|nr:ABC transporter permease [Thermoanaerobaculia bacterium]